ncbi:alpha/beta hydrolase [Streptomyces sp. ODS28]|uniref:alpha/beta fold hydrolase n=1 Tax=Streptomyces sp. ODS28 TaxID=3136688 RepID=UPI0031E6A2E7
MTVLRAHDHGGDGPPLVLLHGYSRSLTDWDTAAGLLTPSHRVLALDLPGHGGSPSVPRWTVPAVLACIDETLDAHGVPEAVVVGHSLGGLLAVEYARSDPQRGGRPRVRGAVNLDGFWWGSARPGAEQVGEALLASAGAVAPPAYLTEQVADAVRFGIPAERAETAARAAARALPDGTWQTLPERAAALEIVDELHRLGAPGVAGWLAGVERPLLVVQAGRRPPSVQGMEWFEDFTDRFAREVADELAVVARTRPTVETERIDATHPMIMEAPEAVAKLVTEFVRGLPG